MTEIATIDIGGTHVRFALATIINSSVASLGDALTLETRDYENLQRAWVNFETWLGRALPRAVAISFAGPLHGEVLKLTNSPWVIRPAMIPETLGVESWTLVNDFGAVGHAVAHVGPEHLVHLCGPTTSLPAEGVISIIGPGTGLGVAHVLRHEHGYHVSETEGGHVNFAPLDSLEDRIVAAMRDRYRRVSAERIVSGPGLRNIYDVLRELEPGKHASYGDADLWSAAIDRTDSLPVAALDRFCLCLGAVAGDIALAQGGAGVVIAGGLGLRLAELLPKSGFGHRFTAKGRFEAYMMTIPVKILTHPQPGLLGAAAAFAIAHAD